MRKHASILAASLAAVLFSGAAMADNKTPDKKPAADAASSQPVNDTWITTKVKSSLLADSDVAGMDIRVVTTNGVVGLSGNVDSQVQADRARQIAQDIEGVARVDDSGLTVGNANADRDTRMDDGEPTTERGN